MRNRQHLSSSSDLFWPQHYRLRITFPVVVARSTQVRFRADPPPRSGIALLLKHMGHTWRRTHCICIASALLCVGLHCVAAHIVALSCYAAMSGHCAACVAPTVMCVELFCAAWSAFRMKVAFHCPSCRGCALLIRRQSLHSGRAGFLLFAALSRVSATTRGGLAKDPFLTV